MFKLISLVKDLVDDPTITVCLGADSDIINFTKTVYDYSIKNRYYVRYVLEINTLYNYIDAKNVLYYIKDTMNGTLMEKLYDHGNGD